MRAAHPPAAGDDPDAAKRGTPDDALTHRSGPHPRRRRAAAFDAALLDRLMDEAGLDVLLATSKHNVQYLLGGYRFFFFDDMDAIG